jgi:hypothetical protein
VIQRACLAALALYPLGWRERYGEEMRELLDSGPARLRTLIDLLRGALDAHLHPSAVEAAPLERMRGTVAATVCCWIAFVLAGSSFQKATEDVPFRAAGHSHALLGTSRAVVVALALLASAALALGALPLLLAIGRQLREEPRGPLLWAVAAPVIAVVVVGGVTTAIVSSVTGTITTHPTWQWGVLAWVLLVVAAACVCALGARAALMRARLSERELRPGVAGAWLAARAMAALTITVAAYGAALVIDDPTVAGAADDPFGASATVAVVRALVVMVCASGLAVLTTRRGRAAARQL